MIKEFTVNILYSDNTGGINITAKLSLKPLYHYPINFVWGMRRWGGNTKGQKYHYIQYLLYMECIILHSHYNGFSDNLAVIFMPPVLSLYKILTVNSLIKSHA